MKKLRAASIGLAGQFRALPVTTAVCALFLFGLLATSESAPAQTNVNEEKGMKPYDSWHGGDLDSVSMTNGALMLHIPLAAFPQRGNLDLSFSIYSNTKQWQAKVNPVQCSNPNDPTGCTPRWVPLQRGVQPQFGASASVEGAYVTSSLDWIPDNECNSDSDLNGNVTYNWSASLTAPDGNAHQFGAGSSSFGCPAPPFRAFDASGILQLNANTIVMPNGTRFVQGTGVNPINTFTDSNGNQISLNANSGVYTDTLGRAVGLPPSAYGTATSDLSSCPSGTASAKLWSVPGLSTGLRTFTFCYANVSIYTSFGQGGTEYGPANNSLLTAIVLYRRHLFRAAGAGK